MTVQRSADQPLSPDDVLIRWSALVTHILGRWDRTGRLAVLAIAATTCVTATLAVLFGTLGTAATGSAVVALVGWLTSRRGRVAAADHRQMASPM